MKKFWTSDTHFNQERTFKYSMRSMYFKNLDQMNREMILRWNKVVGENDTVYHLGDFGDFNFLKYLNGNIILLEGNYERDGISVPTEEQRKILSVYLTDKSVFDYENNLTMVHEPSNVIGSFRDGFYLFGHIHEKQKVKSMYHHRTDVDDIGNLIDESFKRSGLNVGVDVHNFAPIGIDVVNFYRNAIEGVYDEECFRQF